MKLISNVKKIQKAWRNYQQTKVVQFYNQNNKL